jgi:GNAT superfamily N-acetyltransferase
MIKIRVALEDDAPSIREIFQSTYGEDYAYPEFYEEPFLKKLIYSDDTLVLVAEDDAKGKVVGTASVVLESGAYTDLVGEFGRLAVHPTAWGQGIGSMLLQERINRVEDRLHVGFMEARVTHPFSLTNGLRHGFAPVGFLPLKLRFGGHRENTALLVQYFGEALELRRNHPRIIPEAYQLAGVAMDQVGIKRDFIVDENAPPYPHGGEFTIQVLSAQGYSSLLRIERGRLRKREVFGPLRLHYGFFRLRAEHSNYLIAWQGDHIAGAVGFTIDRCEHIVRIFELIHLEDQAVRLLLNELETRTRDECDMCYMEIDVSAHAPGMQRTLLELGYVPAAYVPAMAFHRVERLDVLKMARLLIPCDTGPMTLVPPVEDLAVLILRGFQRQEMLPRIGELLDRIGLFAGLTEEQVQRLAATCGHVSFGAGERIFSQDSECSETYIVLDGEVEIRVEGLDRAVGSVTPGECLGEVALLTGSSHSATAEASTDVRAAFLKRDDLTELVRQRPDIGVVLYRNLARGLGEKLRRADQGQIPELAEAES